MRRNKVVKVGTSDFTRRNFLKTMGLGAAAFAVPMMGSFNYRRLDQYGGLECLRFEATGFFRVEKADRWWLVTPGGSAFLSFGLNHMDTVYLLQDYNIDFWRTQFSFKDPSEPSFREGFVKKVMSDLNVFGMNTLGCHGKKEVFGKITVPYVQGLFFAPTAYWALRGVQSYPDVYSDEFRKRCEEIAENICLPKVNDPFLIGYTFTNVPILTDLDADAHGMVPWGAPQDQRPTWPRALRNRGPETAGKKVFVDLMQKRYPTILEFNQNYGTGFNTFSELLNAVNWSPFEKIEKINDAADNHAFMLDIYEQYYRVTCQAIKQFDPNHLLFGDPLNANTGTTDDIVTLVARHIDLISYQYYGPYSDQSHVLDHWSALTGKPIFNTDSNFTVPYEQMPNPVGWICKTEEERASYFLDFATRAFARPDFIGWNWCGWIDAWESWRPVQQHCGLQDPFGNYHHPMPKVMSTFGSQLYDYALGKRKSLKIG
ncbi:MAG: beta-galactosidase [Bacteroidales bacterium]|nr:beta-galactosidase [Bacteroidales bacterium]